MHHYLGIEVDLQNDDIFLSQESYTNKLINFFRMENAHPHYTSLDLGLVLNNRPDQRVNITEYQRGIGSLQWLASKTQPDIAHAACLLT